MVQQTDELLGDLFLCGAQNGHLREGCPKKGSTATRHAWESCPHSDI